MSVRIPSDQVQGMQQIEAAVSTPEGAGRLLTFTGQFGVTFSAAAGSSQETEARETFVALVGPALTHAQFLRALGSASIAGLAITSTRVPGSFDYEILGVEADWDDENGQVELEVEVSARASGTGNRIAIRAIAFQVTLLVLQAASTPPGPVPPGTEEPAPPPPPPPQTPAPPGSVWVYDQQTRSWITVPTPEAPGSEVLIVMPAMLNFGSVPIGLQSPEHALPITNNGTEPSGSLQVVLAGADANQFHIVGPPLAGMELVPGGSAALRILFQATAAGPKIASLQVTAAPGGSVSTMLTGTGVTGAPTAALLAMPSMLNFGDVRIAESSQLTVSIANSGGTDSGRLLIGLTGPNATEFTLQAGDLRIQGPIPAGGEGILGFLFQPATPGPKNASLQVSAMPGGAVTVALTGAGTTGTTVTPPPPTGGPTAVLVAMPATLDFRMVPLGVQGPDQILTITNNGTGPSGPLQVALVGADANQFHIVSPSPLLTGISLPPGGSSTLRLNFQATSPGPKTAALQIIPSTGPLVTVSITGAAT